MPDLVSSRWPRSHILILILLPIALYLPEWMGVLSADPLRIWAQAVDHPYAFTDGGLLPGNPGWIDGCAGVIVEALGRLVAHDWAHGIVPWWNSYSGVGMPLAGEYQPAAFFLPFVLFLGLPNGLLMMKCTLQIIAALSSYALIRQLRMAPRVALIGGILYAFNGTYAWASDGPSEPLAFLPLAVYGVERARIVNGRGGHWGWLGLGLSYLLLSGFPETAFLVGTLVLGWAIFRLFGAVDRLAFTMRIALAGIASLLIAAPQLIAFLTFVPHAYLGSHTGLNDGTLPASCWAMLLFPYVNGTFFYGNQFDNWYALGGYTGLVLPLLALTAIGGRRERGLRFLLLGYVVAVVGKQAGMPVLTPLVDLIPGVAHTVFYRLSEPVIEAALIVLACFTLDDVARGVWRKHATIAASSALTVMVVVAWRLDRPMRHILNQVSHGPVSTRQYIVFSFAFGMSLVIPTAWLLLRRRRPELIAGALVLEALVLFAFPLLSARHVRPIDTSLIGALRQETGLQRFVTLGPVPPNYGAWFRIASLNHNAIPTPAAFIARLRHDFGDRLDPVTFDGSFPTDMDGLGYLEGPLARNPVLFSALGVTTVLVPPGSGPPSVTPFPLTQGRPAQIEVSPPSPEIRLDITRWNIPPSRRIGFSVGTFGGQSDGTLAVSLCDGPQCARGRARLQGAADNALLFMSLDATIPPHAREMTIRLEDATRSVVLWSRATDAATWPVTRFETNAASAALTPVLSGAAADLYRLNDPAPYFDAGTSCKVQAVDREHVVADCTRPATLIRRELMLPGWTATINGARTIPETYDDLFESVPLPTGRSTVSFAFAPPGATYGWFGMLFGIGLLVAGFTPLSQRTGLSAADFFGRRRKRARACRSPDRDAPVRRA
ncbi:hypothetical protein [Brytella acorum]|uniref:Membrane protein YfhO n=1 Tax=Brytella acorum TaxID=2959299 RepID=A0AA35V4T4_9PROT|nr:hypothetical protein [Brytella acorum]MDF3623735.1 hypothetical protein [Brytella acorum]CAI9119847.1 hypothetical protein LMG32879_000673 [Brytella acorum]